MTRIAALIAGSLAALFAFGDANRAWSQQVQATTSQVGVTDSFYEGMGINWGFSLGGRNGGLFFNRGGGTGGWPPFGGFGPARQSNFGFGLLGGGGNFSFNFFGAQGSRRSINSSSSTVTLPNGGVGGVWDTTIHPFVTGVVPIVGSPWMAPPIHWVSPLEERIPRLKQQQALLRNETVPAVPVAADRGSLPPRPSTAQRGDISVAEIRQQRDAQSHRASLELETLIAQAESAERSGRLGAARIQYRKAAGRASGALLLRLRAKLESLAAKPEVDRP